MNATADRFEFAPPPEPAAARGFALALAAHVLLMIALTWGITWNRETENISVEAELWSPVAEQAAPPPPQVVTAPPAPAPTPRVEPPPAPVQREPDIALEREKKRKEELAQRRREELEEQKRADARERREALEREKKVAEKKRLEEERREKLAEQKAAEEKKKKEELAKAARLQQQDEARLKKLREENMARMMKGLEGGTGAPSATGTAARSSGMSASYAGRVQARVRPHIVFTDDVSGNPAAEVEVRMAPDGTITSSRIIKSSGVKSWDDAVLRALAKTEVLPRDVDGRVPTPLVIAFRPKS